MRPRLIAMGFDDNYTMPALVTLFSARQSFSGTIRVLVAYDETTLGLESISLVEQVCKILEIEVSFEKLTLPGHLIGAGHISSITWARILLMSNLDEEFVWLDCDILLLPGWESLILEDLFQGGTGIAAALDLAVSSSASPNNAAYSAAGQRYVNTGVLLVNPMKLGSEFQLVISAAIARYQELGFQWLDQDVLNYSLGGKSGLLPQELNLQVHISRMRKVEGKVLHFNMDAKPWLGPFRITYFWSFSVRAWDRYSKGLHRALGSDETLKNSVSELRKKAARAESLNWAEKRAPQRLVLALSRFVWR
jgi:lipopolysaccharide biosynthesis glycosyltransferase